MYLDTIKSKYYVLRESYWDKKEKKFKKRKLYLGEFPILTNYLRQRIKQFFGKEIPPIIIQWFQEKEKEARLEIEAFIKNQDGYIPLNKKQGKNKEVDTSKRLQIVTAKVAHIKPIPAHLYRTMERLGTDSLGGLNWDYFRVKYGVVIALGSPRLDRKGKVHESWDREQLLLFMQAPGYCRYFYLRHTHHFCTKRISETSKKTGWTYCDEHREREEEWKRTQSFMRDMYQHAKARQQSRSHSRSLPEAQKQPIKNPQVRQ